MNATSVVSSRSATVMAKVRSKISSALRLKPALSCTIKS